MADARVRPAVSADTHRAQRLLVGGLAGGHLAALAATVVFFAWRGPASGVSCLIAAAVTLLFYTVGQAVQVMMADSPPQKVLTAALVSYAVRVSALAGLLAIATTQADRLTGMDAEAVVVGTIAVVTGWLGAEIWTFSRLRFPVYDSVGADAAPGRNVGQGPDLSC